MASLVFGLIKSVVGLLPLNESSEPIIHTEQEALEIINQVEDDDIPVEPESTKEVQDNECFKRTGEVTFLDNHCGTIDGKYFFDNCTVRDLQIGDKVHYLAYTLEGEMKVSKVLSKYDEWDDESEDTGVWFNRRLVGKVKQRNGREVICDPDNIVINLNKVKIHFLFCVVICFLIFREERYFRLNFMLKNFIFKYQI